MGWLELGRQINDPTLQWHIDRGYHPQFVPVQKGGVGWGNTILNDRHGVGRNRAHCDALIPLIAES